MSPKQQLGVTLKEAAEAQQAAIVVEEQQDGACSCLAALELATQHTARMVGAEEKQQVGGSSERQQESSGVRNTETSSPILRAT